MDNACTQAKEDTKLEKVETQIKRNTDLITQILGNISSIENSLGELNPSDSKAEAVEEVSFRFNRMENSLKGNNNDLVEINERLKNMAGFF